MSVFLYFTALFFFLLLCVMFSALILMQESKSTGLGSSFGGDTSDSLFGTSTADVLRRFTAYLAAAFMIGCLILSVWTQSLGRSSVAMGDLPIEQGSSEVSPEE